MSKHTPPPWIVKADLTTENTYRLWDEDNNYPKDTSFEVMEANSKLISAAPELLEAAIAAEKLFAALLFDPSANESHPIHKLRAAINKATGE